MRTLRLSAVLLAVSLVFHEIAYSIARGGLIGPHQCLGLATQLGVGALIATAAAAAVRPSLGAPGRNPEPYAPFAFAAALLAILLTQEFAEWATFGTGVQGLLAAVAISGLAAPLALGMGAIAAGLAVLSDLASDRLCRRRDEDRHPRAPFRAPVPRAPSFSSALVSGLAFGFARRPPPLPV